MLIEREPRGQECLEAFRLLDPVEEEQVVPTLVHRGV